MPFLCLTHLKFSSSHIVIGVSEEDVVKEDRSDGEDFRSDAGEGREEDDGEEEEISRDAQQTLDDGVRSATFNHC